MTAVWDKVEELANTLKDKFSQTGNNYSSDSQNGWKNYLYSSPAYRRAHVEIVDFRATHKIYILHSTIFPHYNDPSPIWGFDAVCGPNKITGAFHDFSSAGDSTHFMMKWFAEDTQNYKWRKPRELPEWARQIFSPSMIAAGNIQEGEELDDLCSVALKSLDYYLENVGHTQDWPNDYHMAQNRYCHYQKQNPHVINSMVAMGVPREEMTKFVNEVLFPETSDVFIV
jgi:hypothetical protein